MWSAQKTAALKSMQCESTMTQSVHKADLRIDRHGKRKEVTFNTIHSESAIAESTHYAGLRRSGHCNREKAILGTIHYHNIINEFDNEAELRWGGNRKRLRLHPWRYTPIRPVCWCACVENAPTRLLIKLPQQNQQKGMTFCFWKKIKFFREGLKVSRNWK